MSIIVTRRQAFAIAAVAMGSMVLPGCGSFSIDGKWKNVGSTSFGMVQPNATIVFDGENCNFVSPMDTYSISGSGDSYTLECTTLLFSQTLSFGVTVIDNDNIEIDTGGGNILTLQRTN